MANEKIALISLGCAKNLVNSEQMLCLLSDAGYELVSELEGADAVIINTCGFIDEAKSEAIANIVDAGLLKADGKLGKIIVTGCLAERYRSEIRSQLPEADALVGVGSYGEIADVVRRTLDGERPEAYADKNAPVDEVGRFITTGPAWAYLKIAEGCDNRCAYCAIPDIRGHFRSRPLENIVAEAKALAESGVKELILIAQDLTRYGTDIYGRRALAELCRALAELDGVHWLRLHYLYPDEIDGELIDEIAANEKIVKYLDIPIQHINSDILRRMNRRGDGEFIRALFSDLRERIPRLVLRTSLITGLPGEGEAEFEELCEFLREAKIERVGVFPYSPEEGTPAYDMPDRCDFEEAERRAGLIMELQNGIMDEYNAAMQGRTLEVLCTGADGAYLTGRTYADSRDVDGTIYFTGQCEAGQFTKVLVTGEMDGELVGEEIDE
ncbi:MAG: 30S ribosomal protein S12 methylthiotransferase RimO [Oscillospiraceae bacterium]|nr:30S ribosomal protein S12 methylthiotransferase RimO [Oscillospiraceae bacterium]